MRHRAKGRPQASADELKVVTKAALRAADRLEIRNNVLAKIIGLSEPTISRMYKGAYVLPSESKAFELAVLFVRFYRALDGIVGGDDSVAANWLKNRNTVLNGIPLEMILIDLRAHKCHRISRFTTSYCLVRNAQADDAGGSWKHKT